MPTPALASADGDGGPYLTLVICGVDDLYDEMVDAIWVASDGDCEVGITDFNLYVQLSVEAGRGWLLTPKVVAAVQGVVPRAELLRVEATDSFTAAERSRQRLDAAAG